jgi:hypothetical protein
VTSVTVIDALPGDRCRQALQVAHAACTAAIVEALSNMLGIDAVDAGTEDGASVVTITVGEATNRLGDRRNPQPLFTHLPHHSALMKPLSHH